MKIVVIPDVHNKIRLVDGILKTEKDVDRVIFLGDIFDNFKDNPVIITEVARWVKGLVHDERITFLWGNHDITYGFRNRTIPCAGYSFEKDLAIWKVLDESHFRKWKFFWHAQGFLFSHAGLHPRFLPPLWKAKDVTTKNIKEFLNYESEKCLIELNLDFGFHWFFLAGDCRVKPPREHPLGEGGLLWCDARHEFEAVPRLAQVFGHTPSLSYPVIIYGDIGLGRICSPECETIDISAQSYWNVALDTHLQHYAVVEDGHLRIKSTPIL